MFHILCRCPLTSDVFQNCCFLVFLTSRSSPTFHRSSSRPEAIVPSKSVSTISACDNDNDEDLFHTPSCHLPRQCCRLYDCSLQGCSQGWRSSWRVLHFFGLRIWYVRMNESPQPHGSPTALSHCTLSLSITWSLGRYGSYYSPSYGGNDGWYSYDRWVNQNQLDHQLGLNDRQKNGWWLISFFFWHCLNTI